MVAADLPQTHLNLHRLASPRDFLVEHILYERAHTLLRRQVAAGKAFAKVKVFGAQEQHAMTLFAVSTCTTNFLRVSFET
jgi:hypothetical protein